MTYENRQKLEEAKRSIVAAVKHPSIFAAQVLASKAVALIDDVLDDSESADEAYDNLPRKHGELIEWPISAHYDPNASKPDGSGDSDGGDAA